MPSNKDKQLKGGLSALLGNSTPASTSAAPETSTNNVGKSSTPSATNDKSYQTACIVVNREKMDKMRAIARREGLSIKAVLEAAMTKAIDAYELRHGKITLRHSSGGNADELFA